MIAIQDRCWRLHYSTLEKLAQEAGFKRWTYWQSVRQCNATSEFVVPAQPTGPRSIGAVLNALFDANILPRCLLLVEGPTYRDIRPQPAKAEKQKVTK
jgi:hypothetical protein